MLAEGNPDWLLAPAAIPHFLPAFVSSCVESEDQAFTAERTEQDGAAQGCGSLSPVPLIMCVKFTSTPLNASLLKELDPVVSRTSLAVKGQSHLLPLQTTDATSARRFSNSNHDLHIFSPLVLHRDLRWSGCVHVMTTLGRGNAYHSRDLFSRDCIC